MKTRRRRKDRQGRGQVHSNINGEKEAKYMDADAVVRGGDLE